MSDDHIEIHIFGGAVGETILLHMPGNKWGVVDWYSRTKPGPNDPAALLDQHGVRNIEFLCWTHPHIDHCKGMSEFLASREVREFWRFGTATKGDVLVARLHHARALHFGFAEDRKAATEIERILRLAKARRSPPVSKVEQRLVGRQLLYSDPGNGSPEVWSVAPSGNAVADFEDALFAAFDANGTFIGSSYHPRPNDVSAALVVVFGAVRVILGGDVENHDWQRVLEKVEPAFLDAHAVKIPHHGSRTSHSDSLWRTFAGANGTIAVVTSYSPQNLPDQSVLDSIANLSVELYQVFPQTTDHPSSVARRRKQKDLRKTLLERSMSRKRTPPSDQQGCVSLICRRDGHVAVACGGPASRWLRPGKR
jgi:hypothetical protein